MIQKASVAKDQEQLSESEQEDRYLPARMIKELVYCPRLFYLMHVEGQFESNAETTEGDNIHQRVDARTDALPTPPKRDSTPSSTGTKLLFNLSDESGDTAPIALQTSLSTMRSSCGRVRPWP